MNKEKSLLRTNIFLRNKKYRDQMIVEHAAASARIEGVKDAKKRALAVSDKANGSSSKHR